MNNMLDDVDLFQRLNEKQWSFKFGLWDLY